MSQLTIAIDGGATVAAPNMDLGGTVTWVLPKPTDVLELRLLWRTRGIGTSDMQVVDRVRFENPKPMEERPFRLRLPPGPYSFSGKLVSLGWMLELVTLPQEESVSVDLVLSPTGQEIVLPQEPAAP
jgi:hypothetical protein